MHAIGPLRFHVGSSFPEFFLRQPCPGALASVADLLFQFSASRLSSMVHTLGDSNEDGV
jgi:hypothetical protein